MYRVMVVDDEPIIRNGLREMIRWQDYGFEYSGDADNGKSAMELALRVNPDLVLTDINMSHMDGLTFGEELIKKLPDIKLVFISGYQDFKYAQRALQLKAFDYLTKPLNSDQIAEILQKVKAELDQQTHRSEENSRMGLINSEILPSLRNTFLHELICGKLGQDKIRKQIKVLQLETDWNQIYVTVFFVEPAGESPEKSLCTYGDLDLTKGNGYLFHIRRDFLVMVTGNRPDIRDCTANTQILAGGETWNVVCSAVGIPVKDWDSVGISYISAVREIENRFDSEEPGKQGQVNPGTSLLEYEEKLLLSIKAGELEKSLLLLEQIFEVVRMNKRFTLQETKMFLVGLVSLVLKEIQRFGAETANAGKESEETISELVASRLLIEAYSIVKAFIYQACSLFGGKKGNKNLRLMENAIAFINDNLGDADLGVKEVAAHVNVSPNYFGNIFKGEMGEGMTDFVNRLRIEKAKRLLTGTDLKVYEIALLCGFKEPYYFGVRFKSSEGMTPLEFRDKFKLY